MTLKPVNSIYGSKEYQSGHISIFEHHNQYLRNRTNSNGAFVGISYGDEKHDYINLKEAQKSLIKSGFHIFVFEWNKREMIWKIDENIVFTQNLDKYFIISADEGLYTKKGQPFDHDFKLRLSNEFSLDIEYEDINENFIDSEFIIDYVKYYEWNPEDEETNFTSITNTLAIVIVVTIALIIVTLFMTTILFFFFLIRKRNEKAVNLREKNNVKRAANCKEQTGNNNELEVYEI